MTSCKFLQEIKKAIESGVDPDQAIPYDIDCENKDDYIEILYYASQVLPDGVRKAFILERLQEVTSQ